MPYEECQRVLLIVRYPRRIEAGEHLEAPALNIDVAPTVAAFAGVSVPLQEDGIDLSAGLVGSHPQSQRSDYLIETWGLQRGDTLLYSRQVTDGDRIRLFYGDTRAQPRASAVFEFDSGDGVEPGAIAVPIGADADASFTALATALQGIGQVQVGLNTAAAKLYVSPSPATDPTKDAILWEEVDQGNVFAPTDNLPDYLGIRDVVNGFTWVEYETGERELYDLHADPQQLENKADDPAYQSVRDTLASRLEQLLSEIRSR